MRINFDNYLFRCSALGNVVTANGKITQGAETYLKELFIGAMYGVRREAYGKALEKGVATEQDGLKMLNQTLYPDRFVAKISEGTKNDFIIGTPDAIMDEYVYDIKNALDLFTFGKCELTHTYEWQIKSYCWLYGKEKGRVYYCLNNMPDYMVAEEQKKMFYTQRKWATMESPEYLEACEELAKAHNYDNMPLHHKFKIFDVEFAKGVDNGSAKANPRIIVNYFRGHRIGKVDKRIIGNLFKLLSEFINYQFGSFLSLF